MQLNLSKSYENRIKIEKCMKNGLHVRFEPLKFRSEIWKSDRKSGNPIGNMDFRSDFQFSDFQKFCFLQKLIKEKTKKENAFEAKKSPV